MRSHRRREMSSGTIDLIPSGRFERQKPCGQFAPGWFGYDGRNGLAAAALPISAFQPFRELYHRGCSRPVDQRFLPP